MNQSSLKFFCDVVFVIISNQDNWSFKYLLFAQRGKNIPVVAYLIVNIDSVAYRSGLEYIKYVHSENVSTNRLLSSLYMKLFEVRS
jgi:hypothetical protein